MFNFENCIVPEHWRFFVTIPLYKGNGRGPVGKIVLVLVDRIGRVAERATDYKQSRSGREWVDVIFTVK